MSRRRAEGNTVSAPRKDWCTPRDVLDKVLNVFSGGIDLDPCWNANAITYPHTYFDERSDGLTHSWGCVPWNPGSKRHLLQIHRVFVNPPYGLAENRAWAKKCRREYLTQPDQHHIYLVPASFGAKWFEEYLEDESLVVLLGRIQFLGAKWKSDFDLALILKSQDKTVRERFTQEFSDYTIVRAL